ncbi:MAG: hypothetical protein GQ564_06005 [Bacteroidales bacterium]|nr:hypothetical protein [Bacteroidales bacterium]
MKKIGGNYHQIFKWEEYYICLISGGLLFRDKNLKEVLYKPLYGINKIEIISGLLYAGCKPNKYFKADLHTIKQNELSFIEIEVFPELVKKVPDISFIKGIEEEPRAIDSNEQIIAVGYKNKGIALYDKKTQLKISHFKFPAYSFIDGLLLDDKQILVADAFGLRIIDISDVQNPKIDDSKTYYKGWPKDVAVADKYIYVADVLGFKIYDKINDFKLSGKIEAYKNRTAKIKVNGQYVYLACEAIGLKIADISNPENPFYVSGVLLPKGIWDMALYGDFIFLAAYTEGIQKVNLTDIKKPELVAKHQDGSEIIGIHVTNDYVFAACSHNGFAIYDHNLNLLCKYSDIEGRCWTVLPNENKLYVATGKTGVWVFDISNIETPLLITQIKTGDARDLKIDNNLLYVADGHKGVAIFDITNNYKAVKNIPSAAFTRGLNVDENYIYKADGDGGLEIYGKN